MKRSLIALLCPLLLSACSAEVAVDTPPVSQSIPITSVLEPVYVEVAVDLPEATQGLDVTVKEITADLTVRNPSQAFTLETSARLSLTGNATPDKPSFYSKNTLPAYYATSDELLAPRTFAPNSSTPVHITSPALAKAIGQPRIWVIVSNTVTRAGIGGALPLQIDLENIVLHALVSKPFRGLDGALGPGGL
jgi:hypothetical protein